MEIDERLNALLDEVLLRQQQFIDGLSPEQREAASTPERWSAKDVVAHNQAWQHNLAERLRSETQGEPSSEESDAAENARIYQRWRDIAWPEVLASAEQAIAALKREVARRSPEELAASDRYHWLAGRPLAREIASTAYTHPLIHITEFYMQHGQPDQALALQEAGAASVLKLDDSGDWQGTVIYNLACCYAQCGQPEQAVAKLAEALRLRPALRDWSREDGDLRSLHELPAYQALYA